MKQSDFWQIVGFSPYFTTSIALTNKLHGTYQTSQVCMFYLCALATLYDPDGT